MRGGVPFEEFFPLDQSASGSFYLLCQLILGSTHTAQQVVKMGRWSAYPFGHPLH